MCSLNKKITSFLVTTVIVFFGCNADAQNINTPNKTGPLGTAVNTFSGNLYIPRNDAYIPARGFDLNLSFFYNSYNFDQNFGFGNGWGFIYSIKYSIDTAGNNTIAWGDGREDVYTALPGGAFKAATGFFDTLSQYQAGKYLLSELDGTKYYFDNSIVRKITKVQEPNGNYLNFNYTDSLLTSIVNNAGQTISFTYNGLGRMLTLVDAIASPTRTWTYTYDGAGNLKQVTDPLGGTDKYTYLVNGPMKTLSDKNNNTVDIIYYGDYSVRELIGCNKRQSFSYDTTTKITVITDYVPTGTNQVTTYGYKEVNGEAWLSSLVSNCCGFNMKFEFDDNGNKTKQTDANGNITTYTYDSRGNVLTITDALNQTSTFTYSANLNNVTSYTDPKANLYTLTYNSSGDLVQITEPGNLVSTATYSANGDILSSTDPVGNIYTYNYDTYGNPVSVTGPNGYHASLNSDARGNLLSFTDARGNSSTGEYDILNRLKKVTDALNNATQISYDAEGNATTVINKNNQTSHLNYDASNRMVQFTDAKGNHTNLSYDAMDNLVTAKNALGVVENLKYDTRNRLSSITDALNNSSNFSYDPNGNVIAVSLPNGQSIHYTYDNINRVTGISDITGTLGTINYDKNNNITSYTNGTGATATATYDSLNRIKNITDPLGNSCQFSYDKNDNVISVTDRNGFTRNYTYDSINRIKTYTDNNGFVVTVSYDVDGNVTQAKDQNNNITNYTYDNLNRLKTTTYPDGKYIQFGYDNLGNITSKKLTDGTTITYIYDSLNRITTKTLPDGQVYSYAYDALSRVIGATNSSGTVAITYDALNRINSETFDGRTTFYNYNVAGRSQTSIYPDSTIITKNFDTRNRLTSIIKNNTTIVSYQYNNANQVTAKNFANGVTSNMQYDFANRLSNISTSGGSIQNTSFTYDKEMNKTAIIRQNNAALSEQFTYDHGYRITSYQRGATQNTYSYDAVGNRTNANLNGINTNYTINNLNQVTNSNNSSQNINFTYDDNGNLTFDGVYHKIYDAEGRLLKDSASASNVFSYQYDAMGRRVQKTLNGVPYKYSYNGMAQIEERDGITNNLLDRTIFSGFLTPVANEKNGNLYYYHQNELNSVEAITNSSGNLVENYRYDLYGKQFIYDSSNTLISSSLAGNRFGFTGQEYDSATGSNHFAFRNYSPTTGTFNQRDPIGYADGTGMYQYVHNNPANGIDIFGLNDCDPTPNTPSSKTAAEHGDDALFWSGWFSNLGSYLQAYQSSTKLEGIQKVVTQFGGYNATVFAFVEQHGLLANVSTVVNHTVLSVAMIPFNAANTITPAIDMVFNGSEMSAGQIFNNSTNMVSSGATTGVGLYGIFGGAGALSAGSLATAPVAYGGVAVAGGLAIEGSLDYAHEKFTGWLNGTGKGDHFTDVGANNDIPLFTSAVSWLYSGSISESSGFGRNSKVRTDDHTTWRDSDAYSDARNKVNNRPGSTHTGTVIPWKPRIIDCPQNKNDGGPKKRKYWFFNPGGDSTEVIQSHDPNQIIGPDGVPNKHWVSVHDRLPYTILYENSKAASAPAKFVRITSPVELKEDASTFQLGNFGFNNQTFSVPPNTASYYQRLDVRDSLGLYVDITAGYDQVGNNAFWEFQSIDPVTLLPPADPLKGFLLLQDSTKPLNGHAFVNFSMKPLQSAITLDTIGARASIVFDQNDTIPTNIATNTIDAFPPVSHMNAVTTTNGNNPITLSWSGVDDTGGSGIDYYTIYVSTDQVNYNVFIPRISSLDTTLTLPADSNYCFFVLATDRVGNKELLRPNETQCVFIGTPLPITWLYFRGKTVAKDNILDWATANEQNSKQFDVERSLDGTIFGRIGIVNAAGTSNQTNTYQYTDHNIDRLNSNIMFYRLKQLDIAGNFKYSNIVRLNYNGQRTVNSIVYPNPTQNLVTILVGDNSLVGTTATIYDINGRKVETIKITASSQSVNLANYVNGIYFIKLSNNEVLKIEKL